MPNTNNPPNNGTILFTRNNTPSIPPGEYIITVQQELHNTQSRSSNDAIDESYINTKRFVVRGERFSLDATEFLTMFPPANNQGEYGAVLPHLVCMRRTLPWERSVDKQGNGKPWLALLLFQERDPIPEVRTIQIGDLQRGEFHRTKESQEKNGEKKPSTLPATTVSYPDALQKIGAQFTLEHGENYYDSCQAIDIPADLFSTIAPSADDMAWLAHTRTVPVADKAGITEEKSADYSVIIANRLPGAGLHCTVHLVSLEGLAGYLPSGKDYTPAPITLPDGRPASHIRLVSLMNWSFTSIDPQRTFEGILKNLDCGAFQIESTGDAGSAAGKSVHNAFAMGYTAINHHTRQGDSTVSWYRGPCVPFQVPVASLADSKPPAEPVGSSDQLVRYNPDTGMMDISYASAWQIGRLLALQNKDFSGALFNWKHSNVRKTAFALERGIIEEKFGHLLATVPENDPASAVPPGLYRAGIEFIRTTLGPYIMNAGKKDENS